MTDKEKPNQHHWTGWPGAMCFHCHQEDPMEIASADDLWWPSDDMKSIVWKSEEDKKRVEDDLVCPVGYHENCPQCQPNSYTQRRLCEELPPSPQEVKDGGEA